MIRITIEPSYEGAKQIENVNPYKNADGTVKYINATTSAKSAGVKSLRDDRTVVKSYNGSPMVLDQVIPVTGLRLAALILEPMD